MSLLQRAHDNPVLLPHVGNDWEARGAFNGCPVIGDDGRTYLVYRAQSANRSIDGVERSVSAIGLAVSEDGMHFGEHRLFIEPEYEWERFGCEDPRVTKFEGKYYIFYTALSEYPFNPNGIRVGVAVTKDFRVIDAKYPVTNFNSKAMCLFSERVDGRIALALTVHPDLKPSRIGFVFLDRIEQLWSRDFWDEWYDEYLDHTIPLQRSPVDHIEVGAPPLKTDRGWLLVYSYIRNYLYPPPTFGVEAALLDLDNPFHVIAHTEEPLLTPSEDYELHGQVPNVVFPSGALVRGGEFRLYYGAADQVTAVASCPLAALLSRIEGAKAQMIRLRRYGGNPILKPLPEHPWEALAVFNPGAVQAAGRVHMVYRAMSKDNTSVLGYASSADGFNFERSPEPIYVPREDFEIKKVPGGNSGCEDPRLTVTDGRVYMCYTAYNGAEPPRVALTSIDLDDFVAHQWDRWSKPTVITEPHYANKDAAIFPRKVNGKYALLHRIEPDIWVDFVDDLDFTAGEFLGGRVLMSPRAGERDSRKIGIAGPPIETPQGWLLLYHGVSKKTDHHYHVRAALLDRDDPTKVIARTRDPILDTMMPYEREGVVPNVVFPCGHAVLGDILFVYYGGADTVIGVATISLSELMRKLVIESTVPEAAALPENVRPWGRYDILDDTATYKAKRIAVEPGQRLSYQRHAKRAELWVVVGGAGTVTLDDVDRPVRYGDVVQIARGQKHRLRNTGAEPLTFIEVQTGAYFGEDDIERLSDDYGRA
jgi:predicted GH43/DUF377 family glycosyl hydrolase/mannose-6-phosphate isomerase-like protein (cupin superfamily)